MNNNYVSIHKDPLKLLQEGINEIAYPVILTLGPAGKNIILPKGNSFISTRDGVTVARYSKDLDNHIKRYAAYAIQEAAEYTNKEAGDGTTTATVLAQAIFNEGLKYVMAGNNSEHVRRSIEEACKEVVKLLLSISVKIDNNNKIKNIATISANNDESLGNIIAEAYIKVGKDGSVRVELSKTGETYVSFQEGLIINRGWGDTSHYFVTSVNKRTAEYDNPLIAIVDDKVHSWEQLSPIMAYCASKKTPLILMVREIEDTVTAWIVAQKLKNGLPVCLIRTPGVGNIDMIEDVAISVGATIFNQDWQTTAEFDPSMLGSAEKIIIKQEDSQIINPKGKLIERIEELKEQLSMIEEDVKKKMMQERINTLSSCIATIHLHSQSETELTDMKLRVEDAINATQYAMMEGVVSGGGTALLNCRLSNDTIGKTILNKAIEAPIRHIIANAGDNPDKIMAEMEASGLGYDAKEKKLCNLMEKGIIDPVRVTRTALQKATSVATMLLTTGCAICNENKE